MGTKMVQDSSLTAVANAIRAKTGGTASLSFPTEFVSAIGSLSSESWVRPAEYPNLDEISLTGFEGGYYTFDLRVVDYPDNMKWASFYVTPTISTCGAVLERGTLQNGVFTAIESYTAVSNNHFRVTLNPNNGNVQLFRLTGTGITQASFGTQSLNSANNINVLQIPCVEMAVRYPNATSVGGSDGGTGANTTAFTSSFTQRVKLGDMGKNVENGIAMTSAFRRTYNLREIAYFGSKPKPSGIGYMFAYTTMNDIDLTGWDLSKCTSIGQAFYYCHANKIKMANTGLLNPNNRDSVFSYAVITEIDMTNCSIAGLTNTTAGLFNAIGVINLYPPLLGLQAYTFNGSNLSRQSLIRVFNALPTTENALTLTLEKNSLKVSAEEIAIATQKGWTVA